MQSYNGMLAKCQQIYTSYLLRETLESSSIPLVSEVDQMLLALETEIAAMSEAGSNTVLFEKMQQDLLRIRKDLVE